MITRREFGKLTGTGMMLAAVGTSLAMDGCNWESDLENWIPVGEKSFQVIVTLLENAGVINPLAGGTLMALVGIIETGFNDLLVSIQQYQALVPPPAGALAKVHAMFDLIVTNFQNFLSQLNLTGNPITNLVVGLAEIILSTIQAFIGQVPAVTGPVAVGQLRVGGVVVAVVPKMRTRRVYKRDFNALCVAGGHPEAQLKLTLFEHL